jgi:hypothetical protein
MGQQDIWNKRLKAIALGLGLALSALTVRHWCETFAYGHPLCEDCRPDFPQFYAGAKLIWESPTALYDASKQMSIQRSIDSRIIEILPFTYPPFTAAVLMPLGWMPFRFAYAAMTIINLALLVYSIKLLIGHLKLTREQSIWLLLSALCNFGVHSVILQGQISFAILILLTLFAVATAKQDQLSAGVTTALIFLKPQLQVIPFLTLLGRRMWSALAIASTALVMLTLFSIWLVGWAGIEQYIKLLQTYLAIEKGYGSYPEAMHNLRALAQYAVPFPWSRHLGIGLSLCVLAAALWLNVLPLRTDFRTIAVQWIGNFAAGVLITPHLYPHDLSIMIVPTAFALKLCGEVVSPQIILLLLSMGIYPLLGIMFGNRLPPMVPVGFLIILIVCIRVVYRRRFENAENSSDE